ncbi:hypothetical protein ACMDCT_09425 [Halomonadaceae bacterium KBTZ08]
MDVGLVLEEIEMAPGLGLAVMDGLICGLTSRAGEMRLVSADREIDPLGFGLEVNGLNGPRGGQSQRLGEQWFLHGSFSCVINDRAEYAMLADRESGSVPLNPVKSPTESMGIPEFNEWWGVHV